MIIAQICFGGIQNLAFALKKGFELRFKCIDIDRFLQKTIETGSQGAFACASADVTGESHNRCIGLQDTLQTNGNFITRHAGQVDIERDGVRPVALPPVGFIERLRIGLVEFGCRIAFEQWQWMGSNEDSALFVGFHGCPGVFERCEGIST